MLPAKGTLNLALSLSGTYAATGHIETCPDINGPGCGALSVPPEWHDLKLTFSELRLHADYAITRWLSADLLWSLRLVHIGFQLEDAATRQPITPPFGPDLHHRTETLIGPTDPWLSLRFTRQLGPWAFVLRAGATLPLGSTVPNPFALGRQGQVHEHIQFGTGTVDPIIGVDVVRAVGRFSLMAWLLARASLYENPYRYQAGSQLLGGFNVSSDLWTRHLTFTLGVLGYQEQPERWSGITETEGNLGRTDLLLDTAIGWRVAGRWTLTVGGKVPLFSRATGAQLNTPAIGEATVSRAFSLLGG